MNRSLIFIGAWLAIALMAACGTSPKSSFYTLSASPAPERAQTEGGYSVVVGPVTVPEMIDRPQIVTRVGANQVAFSEYVRWAEPLKSEIPRVIADKLRPLLDNARVSAYPQGTDADNAIRVLIDVQRFDSAPGDAATLEVLWAIRPAKGGTAKTGRSLVREPVAGPGYDALIAAHGRALTLVSREIAEAVRVAAKP